MNTINRKEFYEGMGWGHMLTGCGGKHVHIYAKHYISITSGSRCDSWVMQVQ